MSERIFSILLMYANEWRIQISGESGHPNPEISGGRGDRSQNFFSALLASVWSKNKRGRCPRVPPLDPPVWTPVGPITLNVINLETFMNPEVISCGVNVAEVKTVLGNKKIVKTFYRLGSVFLLVFFRFGLPGYSGCSRGVPKCSGLFCYSGIWNFSLFSLLY